VRSTDGEHDLWGCLYRPLGFDESKPHPVVEVIYGGPQTAVAGKDWIGNVHTSVAEQLAALGFVVVMLDGPGTPYRSHAFQRAVHGRIQSCGGLDDHVHATRELARTRPWMDLGRVGIVGGSGGGYATVRAMASYPDLYRAGVAMCGNHDQSAYVALWGESFHGSWSEKGYADQANTTVAGAITGDLLLIHGDMDDNVHPAMSLKVVDAMIRADRHVDLLIVPNAGHALLAHPYVLRRTWDYFVEKLMRRRPPPRVTAARAR
jgi:dipeptidyl aminopeptidase/acylaminoacyl peptidase